MLRPTFSGDRCESAAAIQWLQVKQRKSFLVAQKRKDCNGRLIGNEIKRHKVIDEVIASGNRFFFGSR